MKRSRNLNFEKRGRGFLFLNLEFSLERINFGILEVEQKKLIYLEHPLPMGCATMKEEEKSVRWS